MIRRKPLSSVNVILLLILVILVILPWVVDYPYLIHMLIIVFIGITAAAAFNIIAGLAGQLSLGHAAFYGFSAYCTVLLVKAGWSYLPAIIVGSLASGLLAIPLGLITLRLRGVYFAFATLGAAEILRLVFLSSPQVGAASGIVVPVLPEYSKAYFYYLALASVLASIWATHRIKTSRLGYGLAAILNDELASKTLGINTMLLKTIAFVISAIIAGLAGSIFATYTLYVEPNTVFSAMISIEMQVMAILGGLGTVAGPILGGAVIKIIREVVTYTLGGIIFPGFYLIVYGVLLVIMILYSPQGLVGIIEERLRRRGGK